LRHFTASDGARIFYRDQGAGRPLLFLHGLMAHSGFFREQEGLAGEFRLIAIDLRGHGLSHAANGTLTVDQLASDVAGIAAALGLEEAVGIGWSLGASVLWRLLAGPSSRRFAGAVVVDMTPRVLNAPDWSLGLSREHCEARSEAILTDFPAFAAGAGAAIFAQQAGEARHPLAAWAGEEFARNDSAAIGAMWQSLVEEDLRPLLRGIRQPTLVIHGGQSHLYGAGTADHLVEALPSAAAVRFEAAGHAPHLEQPELFNATLRDFAALLPPVQPTDDRLNQEKIP
jgi:pimeloyl-[acyl-carrier protein] methyl ester esterase